MKIKAIPKDQRSKFLQIRLSPEEHELCNQLAIQSKTSISDYVRSKLKDSIPAQYSIQIKGQTFILTNTELKELLSTITSIIIK